jgi:hypothetical protein
MQQLHIDFPKQNTIANQVILDNNKQVFNRQCQLLLTMLEAGCVMTTSAGLSVGIGDIRARVRDLIKAGIPVQKRLIKGRYKEYFIEK